MKALTKALTIESSFLKIEELIAEDDWWIFDNKKNIASSDCYNYYYSYAKSRKPQSILEIGVRRGYSAVSMAIGADTELKRFVGIDSEIDVQGSSSFAGNLLRDHTSAEVTFLNFDTQLDEVTIEGDPFDIIHIDADHSFMGCSSDLLLCLSFAKAGTTIIIDDALYAPVRAACEAIKRRYEDFLDVQYVTNFRGHCLISTKRGFPDLSSREVRKEILRKFEKTFPTVTANQLIKTYASARGLLETGATGRSGAIATLLDDLSVHLHELAASLQNRIRSYQLDESIQADFMVALENLKSPASSNVRDQSTSQRNEKRGFSALSAFNLRGLSQEPSAEQGICQEMLDILAGIEHVVALLAAKPIGRCFNYLLSEAHKHFSYLYERLYSQQPTDPSIKGLTLDEISSSDLRKRLETFEGHGLAVVLSDALINVVTSLNRELETQYWMGYWDIATNQTWQQMVLKETGEETGGRWQRHSCGVSPIPFPVKTQAEYSQFYASQIANNAGGVSAKPTQPAQRDLFYQLTQHPTDHAFRLATSIYQIKMLLAMLQERHPHETIRWLDVGCGIGYIANKVGWEGEFVGIDVADALINYANKTRFSDRYQYLIGGFEEARSVIGGKKFHLITATEVIEHIFDPLGFVNQMKTHTCDMIYASSPLCEAIPTQPSREHLWSFGLESYEQLFRLSTMKIIFSSSVNVGSFIGQGNNWLSVAATTSNVLRVWPNTESKAPQ